MTKTMDAQTTSSIMEELRVRLMNALGNDKSLSAETENALLELEALVQSNAKTGILGGSSTEAKYEFDRKFLFRVLVLGNAQLAQIIQARGPNMQTNAACAGGHSFIEFF